MQKIVIATLLIGIVLLTGCVIEQKIEIPMQQETQECYVQDCHFTQLDVTCAPEPVFCTLEVLPTDYCGQFVSCNDSCNVVEKPEYKECVSCFAKCNSGECSPSKECVEKFPGVEFS